LHFKGQIEGRKENCFTLKNPELSVNFSFVSVILWKDKIYVDKSSQSTGSPRKNPLRIFMTYWMIFSKLFLYSKISFISTSSKKEISILSHIAKKLQAQQFSQNCLSEKAPASYKSKRKVFWKHWRVCNFFAIWLRMLISFLNDLDIQLILESKLSFEKNYPVCPKNL
jgi:hypothetical protein